MEVGYEQNGRIRGSGESCKDNVGSQTHVYRSALANNICDLVLLYLLIIGTHETLY